MHRSNSLDSLVTTGSGRRRRPLYAFRLVALVFVCLPVFLFSGCADTLVEGAEALRNAAVWPSLSPSLKAAAENHAAVLSWDSVEGSTGYNLYWSDTLTGLQSSEHKVEGVRSPYNLEGLSNNTAYYCAVTAVSAEGLESAVSATVRVLPHRYLLYVNDGGISGAGCDSHCFVIDAADGGLSELPTGPVDVGSYPYSIAVSPTADRAFITCFNTNTIIGYTVSAATGALTPAASEPYSGGNGGASVAFNPSGEYLYVVNSIGYSADGGSSLSTYAIGSGTTLTPVSGSPYNVGYQPNRVAVDPSGKFVYVTQSGASDEYNIYAFSVNPSGGTLSALSGSPFSAAGGVLKGGPDSIVFHPDGKYFYIGYVLSKSQVGVGHVVGAFSINTATGLPSHIEDYELSSDVNQNVRDIAMDPSGKYLFVLNRNVMDSDGTGSSIAVLAIDSLTGQLSSVPGSPFALRSTGDVSGQGITLVVDPSGAFIYVAINTMSPDYNGYLRRFSIDGATGALSRAGADVAMGKNTCTLVAVSLP